MSSNTTFRTALGDERAVLIVDVKFISSNAEKLQAKRRQAVGAES